LQAHVFILSINGANAVLRAEPVLFGSDLLTTLHTKYRPKV